MRILVVVLLWALCSQTASSADSSLVWSADIRVRGEADGRDFNNKTPLFGYTTLRTRLGVRGTPSEGVHVVVQLQDGRLFGSEQPSAVSNTGTPQSQFLDLHQGYLQLDRFAFDGLTVQAGRMELSYGDEQMVGQNDWSAFGQAFDLVRIRFQSGGHSADVFAAKIVRTTMLPVQVSPFTVDQPPDQGFLFSGFWYSLPPLVPIGLAVSFFHEWDARDNVLSRGTLGLHATASSHDFLGRVECEYQGGHMGGLGVSAFMVTASVGYVVPGGVADTLSGGIRYLSGTGAGDQTDHTFSTTFGSPHDQSGAMDYFGDPAAGTNGRGLQDLYARCRLELSGVTGLGISLHQFTLAKAWSGENLLGQEADLLLRYSAWTSACLEGGISLFHPGSVMKAWYNQSDLSVWGYIGARVWL